MSALLEKAPKLGRPAKKDSWAPGLPQVNLLPPEVRATRALSRLRLLLGVAVVAVAALCVVMYVFAVARVHHANGELAKAMAHTSQLTREQVQYAPVTVVIKSVAQLQGALRTGSSTEILWAPYVKAVTAKVPQDASIDTMTVEAATPMALLDPATDVLQPSGAARISLQGRVSSLPKASDWVDALNSIPGFSDAQFSSLAVTGDEKTDQYYKVTASVVVSKAALAHRFEATEGGK